MSAFVFALLLVVISFRLQEHIGLNMADEGFLWNGTNRTLSGLVPIRDFKSYDPGRYYWTSFLTRVFGSGIKGVRRSVAVFQFLGLWAGLDASTRLIQSWWETGLVGVLMLWWMQPRYKRFEHAMTLISIWIAVQLFENSVFSSAYIGVGCFVGVAAFMGRNHGVYAFLSFLSLFLIVNVGSDLQTVIDRGLWAVLGLIIGYSPMLLMWILVPGMFRKYFSDKVARLLAGRVLKYMKLDFPWPWRVKNQYHNFFKYVSNLLVGIFLIIMPAVYVGSILYIFFTGFPKEPEYVLLLVSSIIGFFYLHHALIRPDVDHLCEMAQPFILAVLSIACLLQNDLAMMAIMLTFSALSFLLVGPMHPALKRLVYPRLFVDYQIHGDTLKIEQRLATTLNSIKTFVDASIGKQRPIFIAPYYATLYPVLEIKTPVFSDCLLFPETNSKQKEIIADLDRNKVDWLFISDHPLDSRDELRFSNTHSQVWDYISENFEAMNSWETGISYVFYKRRNIQGHGDGVISRTEARVRDTSIQPNKPIILSSPPTFK